MPTPRYRGCSDEDAVVSRPGAPAMNRVAVLFAACCMACTGPVAPNAGFDAGRDTGVDGGSDAAPVADASQDSAPPCVPDCAGRACGPDTRCGGTCGTCEEPLICSELAGHCLDLDLSCPASGSPWTAYRAEALGIATNELIDSRYDVGARAALLARTGARYGQIGIRLPDTGAADWSAIDGLLGSMRGAGLDLVVLLFGPGVPDARWRDFVRASVLRYGSAGRGWVADWQLWNEPNGPLDLFGASVDDYVALLDATYEEVHAADSSARVWAPSVVVHANNDAYGDGSAWPASLVSSAPIVYLDRVLETGRFDVVSVHLYEPDPARMLDVQLTIVERMVARDRRATPLVVNEGNYTMDPARSPPGSCPYAAASEAVHAQDVAHFYACLLGANAAQVLWFNGSDRYTGLLAANQCDPDSIRRTGVLAFAGDPTVSFEPSRPKDGYYVLGRIARVLEQHRLARARIEAVPSPCRIALASDDCATTLMWTRRDPSVGTLQIRRDGAIVGCAARGEAMGVFAARVGRDRVRFELVETVDCTSVTGGTLVDTVFVRGEELPARVRGAVFAVADPCRIAPAETTCASTIGIWTEGLDGASSPNVQVFAGASLWRCLPSNEAHILETGSWQSPRGVLYRLYPAASCAAGALLGPLLAATRAHGEP